MNAQSRHPSDRTEHPLTVYLRDHYAGSAAGLALVQRCRRANPGTELDQVLAGIEAEIEEDRRSLRDMMSRLSVSPSEFKAAVGTLSEFVGRLKYNGRLVGSSPSSTVVELEGLAAGILTKGNLWRSLRVAAPQHPGLDGTELERLIQRADDQLQRVNAAHDGEAAHAFGERTPISAVP